MGVRARRRRIQSGTRKSGWVEAGQQRGAAANHVTFEEVRGLCVDEGPGWQARRRGALSARVEGWTLRLLNLHLQNGVFRFQLFHFHRRLSRNLRLLLFALPPLAVGLAALQLEQFGLEEGALVPEALDDHLGSG